MIAETPLDVRVTPFPPAGAADDDDDDVALSSCDPLRIVWPVSCLERKRGRFEGSEPRFHFHFQSVTEITNIKNLGAI